MGILEVPNFGKRLGKFVTLVAPLSQQLSRLFLASFLNKVNILTHVTQASSVDDQWTANATRKSFASNVEVTRR